MKGHGQRAIAVMEGPVLLGVLTMEMAQSLPDAVDVRSIMRKNPAILSPKQVVVKAAQQFVDDDIDVGVVMDDERFYGVVTSNMLLKELRRSWDPLTGLGWSDRLREFGIEQLAKGQEITILFIDLDNFCQYNKALRAPCGRPCAAPCRSVAQRHGGRSKGRPGPVRRRRICHRHRAPSQRSRRPRRSPQGA